jgi:iron complex outermembrane receptor protein
MCALKLAYAACLAGALLGNALVVAQPEQVSRIPEIVVTAERRLADIQSVPLSVVAVTNDDIRSLALRDSVDITSAVPGVQFGQQGMGATPFVRGVGAMSGAVGNEAPVSMYVDGVYFSMPNTSVFDLGNIDQIEILKGPQGTLFGRNATGGVIQVVTRRPEHDASGEVSLEYASDATTRSSLYATRGFGEALAASVTLYGRDQGTGWGTNRSTGAPTFEHEERAARGKLSWTPSPRTRALFSAGHHHRRGEDGIGYHFVPGALGIDGASGYAGFYDSWADPQDNAGYRHSVFSAQVEHEFPGVRLVNIASWQEVDGRFTLDQDATPLTIVNAPISQYGRTITEELQVLSRPGSAFAWIAGFYYLNDLAAYDPLALNGSIADPFSTLEIHSRQRSESYAVFGQTTLEISERARLTVGARYTRDERDVMGTTLGLLRDSATTLAETQQSTDWDEPTWRVAFARDMTPNLMAYVSWDRGFKSGVYNLLTYAAAPVNPEELDAYQAGIKSDWLDHRLRLNAAAFRYQYRNIQVESIVAGATISMNAAAARMSGLEVDLEYVPSRAFTVRAALAFLDGRYTDFANAPITTPLRDSSGTLSGGNAVISGDATGFRTVRSPSRTATINGRYRLFTELGEVGLSVGYYHSSGFAWDPDNRLQESAYGILNVTLDWTSADERVSVRAAGSNLNEAEVCLYANASALGDLCSPRAPRAFSVGASFRF